MADSSVFLYVKPDYDEASIVYLKLTEPVRDYAQSIGYTVIDLEANDAMPYNIYNAITQYDPAYVFLSGHGCETLITAQNYEDVFWIKPGCEDHTQHTDMISALSGRTTFLMSCYCGQDLAPAIFNAGGENVVGWTDEYTWVVDTDYEPIDDPFALSFFDAPNYYMSLILDGVDISQAFKQTVDRYNILIASWSKWIKDNPNGNASDLARSHLSISLLAHDRDVMMAIGQGYRLESTSTGTGINPIILLAGAGLMGSLYMQVSGKEE